MRSIFLVAALFLGSEVAAQDPLSCGSLDNPYGPFDYTNPDHNGEKLSIVEEFHFDAGVENLKGHAKPGGIPQLSGDIDYTLRAFPNHHRALYAMVRYHLSNDPVTQQPMRYTPECYFDRAIRFKSDDAVVRMVHAIFLQKLGNSDDALEQYQEALVIAPNSAEAHYNIGLLYFDRTEYSNDLAAAKKAYALGHPLPGLRRKLERVGVWNDN